MTDPALAVELPPGWTMQRTLETVPDVNAGTPAASGGFRRYTWRVYKPAPVEEDPPIFVLADGSEDAAAQQALTLYQTTGPQASGITGANEP